MSNKTKPAETMMGKPSQVPKRRFPEFRNAPEWEPVPLGEICEVTNGESNAQDHDESGIYPLFDRSEVIKKTNKFLFDEEATIIPGEGMRFVPKYYKGKFDLHQRAYALIRPKCNGQFLYYQMDYLQNLLASKAVLSTVLSLRLPIIKSFSVALPIGLNGKQQVDEQKKIADCLSSVDEMITAQAQKVEALKAHKKGLMQLLFPAEGKTLPKLRFPEFRNAPEWKQKKLGQLADVLMCKRIFAEETNAENGVPFFKIGTLGGRPDAFISKELFDEYRSKYNFPRKGEILITCSGTVGKCLPYDGKDAYYQDSNIVWLDNPTLEISNEFLHSLLIAVDWGKLNSTTITRIYGPDLRGLHVTYPVDPNEQDKVCSFLLSLDAIITAQSQKVEALKAHKKGLMQQLFPVPHVEE